MTERRKLKSELSKLKHLKSSLPRLIDCSNVYGDGYFTSADIDDCERKILEIEAKIKQIDEQV